MNVVFYTRDLRDIWWVLPIQQGMGGTFCSEVRETIEFLQGKLPEVPSYHLPIGNKLTVGRNPGETSVRLKRKVHRLRLSRVARDLNPDVIVTTSNHRHAIRRDVGGWLSQRFTTFPRVKQVQAFHGVSSKKVKFNPWMAEYDLLLLPGPRERDNFEQLGILQHVRYALIGHPKSDRVIRGELTRETARTSYGLPERPTVLYAPTYGALSSFYRWGLAICKAVPDDCNLIVKPHPNLLRTIQSNTTGNAMLDAVREHLQLRHGLWLSHEPDVTPAMAAADVLVTDYSSVAEEFLVFDRPLVFADHLATASGRDKMHRDKGDWDGIFKCGIVVTEPGPLREAVMQSFTFPEQHGSARRALRDYVFENLDGRCAQRAADAIRQIATDQ